ncbi:MAG: YicC/YloC family endoribonuclease, partial [Blautia sp.]
MIKSMTGFGRAEAADQQRKITVELKSVNHRYLDMNIKMPKKLSFFEVAIRNFLKNYVQRGKVDIFITFEDYTQQQGTLKYNQELASEYVQYFRWMGEDFGLENDVKVSHLMRCPEVLTMEEQSIDETELWASLEGVLRQACEKFVEARTAEGKNLKRDLLAKLQGLEEKVILVESRTPEVVAAYREKLTNKMNEMLEDTQIEESRIAAEVVLFAAKICNDEETVRLRSHIKNMSKILRDENVQS